ncbi:hypothetical protein T06_14990 [Trichinella sp. T6]|nr:hypothetical protein T06_14990 [Trichinella sp. T6]
MIKLFFSNLLNDARHVQWITVEKFLHPNMFCLICIRKGFVKLYNRIEQNTPDNPTIDDN